MSESVNKKDNEESFLNTVGSEEKISVERPACCANPTIETPSNGKIISKEGKGSWGRKGGDSNGRLCCPRLTSFLDKHLALQENITASHVVVYMLAVMMTIASFVFMNYEQSYLITVVFGIDEQKGSLSGELIFADEILAVLIVGLWGFVSDFVGRTILYSMGFIIMSIALFLYPSATEVRPTSFVGFFSSLLFFRLIFSVGSSIVASLMAALLADTTSNNCRGKFAGIVGLFSGIGAVIGVLFFPSIPSWFMKKNSEKEPFEIAYYVVAVCQLLIALFILFFISPGPPASSSESSEDRKLTMNNMKRKFREALDACGNPLILLAYLSGFVARTLTMINVSFVTLWAADYYRKVGLCPRKMPNVTIAPCPDAYARAHKISGILQVASLVMAPFYGYLANRVCGPFSVAIAAVCTILSTILLITLKDPRHSGQIISAIIGGAGQIGVIVSGLALVSSYSPINLRGSISGAYSFCGAMGILLNSQLSGYLFDKWTPLAPFILELIWTSILFLCTIVVAVLFTHYYRKDCSFIKADKGT